MKYEVQLSRDIRQYLTVEVEANNSEQAGNRAVVIANESSDKVWCGDEVVDMDVNTIALLTEETKS